MILSQRAPSSLNMSSYRAVWTHFRLNFIFFQRKIPDLGPKILDFFLKCRSSHPAILINSLHIWECRSQTVSMEELDLRIFDGNF